MAKKLDKRGGVPYFRAVGVSIKETGKSMKYSYYIVLKSVVSHQT